jgi:hypothetical protein
MSDAYPEVRPMTADEISRGVAAGQHLPDADLQRAARLADYHAASSGYGPIGQVDDQYRQRVYQTLLARGESPTEALSSAEFWARLKSAAPEHVHGPGETIEEAFGLNIGPSITQDPITGVRTYSPGYQPQAAATSYPAGGPPVMLEYSRSRWLGMAQPINRFSLNPGAEYYAWVVTGTPPTMFAAGDLPIVTGSGVDPSILRWVAWPIRHTAAYAASRREVVALTEVSLEGDPEGWHDFVSPDGRAALDSYFAKIGTWVTSLPVDEDGIPAELSLEDLKREMQRFYPDESGGSAG